MVWAHEWPLMMLVHAMVGDVNRLWVVGPRRSWVVGRRPLSVVVSRPTDIHRMHRMHILPTSTSILLPAPSILLAAYSILLHPTPIRPSRMRIL